MPPWEAGVLLQGGDKMDTNAISWIFAVTIGKGNVDDLKALIKEMAEQTEASEPGTLRYQWMISDDGISGQVQEEYRDSEAALTHLASFNENYADRLMTLVEPEGMVVFGDPGAKLRQELAGAEPVYMHAAGGFER